jgi:hypothetical protein
MLVIASLLLASALAQDAPCISDAAARLREFDTAGAVEKLERAAVDCEDARVALPYLQGLLAAREAYRDGGSAESLEPVRRSIAALDDRGASVPGPAQIARLVLLAAVAAAQSERDEMAIFLDEALRQESLQLAVNQPAAPLISAHEAAGDLWLEVHRFEDARRAYETAASALGSAPRLTLGRARAAARLSDRRACGEYATLIREWGAVPAEPPEIAEARMFVDSPQCR